MHFLACIKFILSALYKASVDYRNYVQIFEHVMDFFFLKNDLINLQTAKVPWTKMQQELRFQVGILSSNISI